MPFYCPRISILDCTLRRFDDFRPKRGDIIYVAFTSLRDLEELFVSAIEEISMPCQVVYIMIYRKRESWFSCREMHRIQVTVGNPCGSTCIYTPEEEIESLHGRVKVSSAAS